MGGLPDFGDGKLILCQRYRIPQVSDGSQISKVLCPYNSLKLLQNAPSSMQMSFGKYFGLQCPWDFKFFVYFKIFRYFHFWGSKTFPNISGVMGSNEVLHRNLHLLNNLKASEERWQRVDGKFVDMISCAHPGAHFSPSEYPKNGNLMKTVVRRAKARAKVRAKH